jgi:hypothetical protein
MVVVERSYLIASLKLPGYRIENAEKGTEISKSTSIFISKPNS